MDNTFDYQEFLHNKHSALQTSDEAIEKVVKKATGEDIKRKTRLIVGETNEVYDVTLKNSQEVIIRIFHSDQNRFINEEWAIEHVSKYNVPVAHMLLIEEERSDTPRIYCVMTKIAGTPLSEMKEYKDPEFARKIIKEAGALLANIHKAHPKGFGELLGRGIGEHKSYEEWLQKIISNETIYGGVAEKYTLDSLLIHEAISNIKKNIHIFHGEASVLCHSDIGPKHIIIKNDRINGIIDFGNSHGASPIHDFAWWDFWQQKDDELEWLKEGYTTKSIFDKDFDKKFHIIRLIIGLELLWWNDNVGNLGGIKLSEKSIPEDVAFFT